MSFTVAEFLAGCVGTFRDLRITEVEQDSENEDMFSLMLTSTDYAADTTEEDRYLYAIAGWFPEKRVLNVALWQPISTWGMESDEEALSFANTMNTGADSVIFMAVITPDLLEEPSEEEGGLGSLFRLHTSLKVPEEMDEGRAIVMRDILLATLYDLLAETTHYRSQALSFTREETDMEQRLN